MSWINVFDAAVFCIVIVLACALPVLDSRARASFRRDVIEAEKKIIEEYRR